jgi:hypothetical protein
VTNEKQDERKRTPVHSLTGPKITGSQYSNVTDRQRGNNHTGTQATEHKKTRRRQFKDKYDVVTRHIA